MGGSVIRTQRRRRRRGVVQLGIGTDKTGTHTSTQRERVVRWVGSRKRPLHMWGREGEADETLLRLRGKSCVAKCWPLSPLCACPDFILFFANSKKKKNKWSRLPFFTKLHTTNSMAAKTHTQVWIGKSNRVKKNGAESDNGNSCPNEMIFKIFTKKIHCAHKLLMSTHTQKKKANTKRYVI